MVFSSGFALRVEIKSILVFCIVTLAWQLQFEFITSPISSDRRSDAVETMTWTLPITVVTADPMQLLHDTFPFTQLITL